MVTYSGNRSLVVIGFLLFAGKKLSGKVDKKIKLKEAKVVDSVRKLVM